MPLLIPNLSDRKYQDLLDEAVARISVHNPEWINFNDSDPGITLLQLFAFLTENLLYRSNQIPERNRRKFLSLLGIPLQPATPAQGLATITNERGPLATLTLPANLEVRAGQVPFRTAAGLDTLPVEWRVVYKKQLTLPPDNVLAVYRDLYATYGKPNAQLDFLLYQSTPLIPPLGVGTGTGVDLAADTMDGSLWIALLRRAGDRDRTLAEVREAIAGKTISLGLVPALHTEDQTVLLSSSLPAGYNSDTLLTFEIPAGGSLGADRQATYRPLPSRTNGDLFKEPAIVELTLPAADRLGLWDDVEPLEPGVGNLPPSLDDTNLNDRLVTWLRVRLSTGVQAPGQGRLSVLWAGLNTVRVSQRAHVTGEPLPDGTGVPDQSVKLARSPVIPKSVQLMVTVRGKPDTWQPVDDLYAAGPEIAVPDPRLPPGTVAPPPPPSRVYSLDAESGSITFGDGLRGTRPPFGAQLRADYDYSVGKDGNVGAGAITSGPNLPAGFKVNNPVATWGGVEAESVTEGEKQIARYLQHRDRLVSRSDFETIVSRTPGVEVGRVEIIPAFNPDLAPNEPGDTPGAVTVMVIPRRDPIHPDAPVPDRQFLNTVCNFLEPRRLVTTEVAVRGPTYRDIWISVGIRVVPGAAIADVREAVKAAIVAFLSPLPPEDGAPETSGPAAGRDANPTGWPLRTPLIRLQLWAVASRVPGVLLVNDLLLAADRTDLSTVDEQVDLTGLDLPHIAGISVTPGTPLPLEDLRTQTQGAPTGGAGTGGVTGVQLPAPLPVPVIPVECQ